MAQRQGQGVGNIGLHFKTRFLKTSRSPHLGLGVIAISLLGVLLVTGLALMFWYVPAPTAAYERVVDLSGGALPLGGLMRVHGAVASNAPHC